MPRFAFSDPSIGSTTTWTRPLPSVPTSSDTMVTSSTCAKRASTARSAASSIAVVSSPPSPVPTTGSRSARVGSSATPCRTSTTPSRQSASQSVKRVEQQARGELGEEVGALLRHRLAALRDRTHLLDRRRAKEERRLGAPGVDRGDGLLHLGRVADAFRLEALDEGRVELGFGALEHARLAVTVERDRRPVTRKLFQLS